MTDSMVERVARALHTAHYARGRGLGPSWDSIDRFEREMWMFSARAAIAAMREPTEAMKSCHEEVHWGYSCHVCGGLTEGWYKMFDEALK